MIPTATLSLEGGRNDPFWATVAFTGINLTGATMRMSVRQYPDQPGAALIDITNTVTVGEGLRVALTDTDADGFPRSWIEILINKAKMQALPAAPIGDAQVEFFYDIEITPADDGTTWWTDPVEQTWLRGPFIVKGSAVL